MDEGLKMHATEVVVHECVIVCTIYYIDRCISILYI